MTQAERVGQFSKAWDWLIAEYPRLEEELNALTDASYANGLTQGREEMRLEILSAIEELGGRR